MQLNTFIKKLYLLVLAFFAIGAVFYVSGCSKINESVANENIQIPTIASKNIKGLISYLEVVELINSTKSSLGIRRSTFDSLEKTINCKLIILDSLTSDGNGFKYKVIFPNKGESLNSNNKNYDGNYRFGTFLVDLNFNYREINAISTIKIDSSSECFIANSKGEYIQIIGNFKFERIITNKINISITNGKLITKFNNPLIFSGDFAVSWTDGESTDGVLNDVMVYNGSGIGKYADESFKWNTSLPLEKNLEFGCASNIVKGVLQIEMVVSKKIFRVDFDPFNNKSCDSIIKIYILGKEYEITI